MRAIRTLMSNRHLLRLIRAQSAASRAAGRLELRTTNAARRAQAARVAEGTDRVLRQAVWALCAEGVRRQAVG